MTDLETVPTAEPQQETPATAPTVRRTSKRPTLLTPPPTAGTKLAAFLTILYVARQAGQPTVSAIELKDAMQVSHAYIGASASNLMARGLIERVGRGEYVLTERGVDAARGLTPGAA